VLPRFCVCLFGGRRLRAIQCAASSSGRSRYLRGVDIGLTQTNILNSFRRSDVRLGQSDDKIAHIAKLFNGEVHLITGPGILPSNSCGAARSTSTPRAVAPATRCATSSRPSASRSRKSACPRSRLEKVKSGKIAATALIAGKPVRSLSHLSRNDRLHFVPIPYPAQLISDYLPATVTHDDYPDLVAAGATADTMAVGAVMIATTGQRPTSTATAAYSGSWRPSFPRSRNSRNRPAT
jgi:uncharacterized protein